MVTGAGNHFVFVAPMYNAAETLGRMLHSLFGQSYPYWRLILIDDLSDSHHVRECKRIIKNFHAHDYRRIDVIWNTEKRWEVANVLYGISRCKDEEIVCRIDADDWLTDLDALAMIDSAYRRSGCDLLWTAHRWGFSDKNISADMPQGVDPYKHPWVSSHLKTFRKRLLNGVKDENYRGEDGEYFRRIGDQAIYLPALMNCSSRVFLPRVMYHYTIDDVPETYQTDDARFQRDEAIYLRQRGYIL